MTKRQDADMDIAINENCVAARTLVKAAHDFLLEYLRRDGWRVEHDELAVAATAVVFSASFVDSYYKHELLHAVNAKLPEKPGRQPLSMEVTPDDGR